MQIFRGSPLYHENHENITPRKIPAIRYMYTADTLSQAPLSTQEVSDLEELAQLSMDACITHLPASHETLSELKRAQNSDPVIIKYCRASWPNKVSLNEVTVLYWEAHGNLTLHNILLLYDTRIMIPASKQQQILRKIHEGRQGIQPCRLRATLSVWWPRLSAHIEEFIKSCPHCVKEHSPLKEPLMPTPLPDYPWQRVGSDLFTSMVIHVPT